MKHAIKIRDHFNKFNDKDKIKVKDIKQMLDDYIKHIQKPNKAN